MVKQLSQTAEKIKTSKKEILLQILLVFVFPILLLQTGIIPISLRIWVLVVTVSILLLILLKEKWTLEMLHIETHNFKKFIFPYILFTAVSVFIIIFFSEKIGREEFSLWWSNRHFIYLFFVVSVFQEIAYRGYLIPALRKIFVSPILIIIINALIFAYMHSIYGSYQLNLLLAFIGGLGFAAMYIKYPNLVLVTLSHSVLNFSTVLYGFFIVQ